MSRRPTMKKGRVFPDGRRGVSRRQFQVYRTIVEHFDEHGIIPTYREIQERSGLTSMGTVYRAISELATSGWIKRDRHDESAVQVARGIALCEPVWRMAVPPDRHSPV